MEFFTYLLLSLSIILSLVFGIYLSIIAFEELQELYNKIRFFRTLFLLVIIGCLYFLDVNTYYKMIASSLLVVALGIKILFPHIDRYGEYLLFMIFGFVISLSMRDAGILLVLSVSIVLSNFLLSSLLFNDMVIKKHIDVKNEKIKIYAILSRTMLVFMIFFVISATLFYFII